MTLGWVDTLGNADDVARTIRLASLSEGMLKGERAATIDRRFNDELLSSDSKTFAKYPMKPGSHS
jgi:hypothetical protein